MDETEALCPGSHFMCIFSKTSLDLKKGSLKGNRFFLLANLTDGCYRAAKALHSKKLSFKYKMAPENRTQTKT